MPSTMNINDLPDDMLDEILVAASTTPPLSAATSLKTLALVCKQWNERCKTKLVVDENLKAIAEVYANKMSEKFKTNRAYIWNIVISGALMMNVLAAYTASIATVKTIGNICETYYPDMPARKCFYGNAPLWVTLGLPVGAKLMGGVTRLLMNTGALKQITGYFYSRSKSSYEQRQRFFAAKHEAYTQKRAELTQAVPTTVKTTPVQSEFRSRKTKRAQARKSNTPRNRF